MTYNENDHDVYIPRVLYKEKITSAAAITNLKRDLNSTKNTNKECSIGEKVKKQAHQFNEADNVIESFIQTGQIRT